MKGGEGYLIAKREMQEALMRRINKYEEEMIELPAIAANVDKHKSLKAKIAVLEEFRSFTRNVMLWDTKKDEE
jgi:hypothetical protein